MLMLLASAMSPLDCRRGFRFMVEARRVFPWGHRKLVGGVDNRRRSHGFTLRGFHRDDIGFRRNTLDTNLVASFGDFIDDVYRALAILRVRSV